MTSSSQLRKSELDTVVKTEVVKYPCPKCGNYYKPFMHNKKGFAYMLCKKCKVQFKTSTKVSSNFRKFCSKLGSAPNRSQAYYTSTEKLIKEYLVKLGLREGIDFIHNCRVKNYTAGYYYWLDFYLPKWSIYIPVNPAIWHNMWGREKSEKKKYAYLAKQGLRAIIVDGKNYKDILKKELKEILNEKHK